MGSYQRLHCPRVPPLRHGYTALCTLLTHTVLQRTLWKSTPSNWVRKVSIMAGWPAWGQAAGQEGRGAWRGGPGDGKLHQRNTEGRLAPVAQVAGKAHVALVARPTPATATAVHPPSPHAHVHGARVVRGTLPAPRAHVLAWGARGPPGPISCRARNDTRTMAARRPHPPTKARRTSLRRGASRSSSASRNFLRSTSLELMTSRSVFSTLGALTTAGCRGAGGGRGKRVRELRGAAGAAAAGPLARAWHA